MFEKYTCLYFQRHEYNEFVREMIIRPGNKGDDEEESSHECIDHVRDFHNSEYIIVECFDYDG